MARKMAARDRRSSPISRLEAKAVNKIQDENSVGGDKTLMTGGHVALLIQNTKEERRLSGAAEGARGIEGQPVAFMLRYLNMNDPSCNGPSNLGTGGSSSAVAELRRVEVV